MSATHHIFRVEGFQFVAPHTLRVKFDDHTEQTIDFKPVLAGELFGPLRELSMFNKVHPNAPSEYRHRG
jgi:hypothetical protein